MDETRITVRIIHFDDEVNSVSSIPNSLFNYFVHRRESWVSENECEYQFFVRSFVIRPTPDNMIVEVKYHLTDDVEECRELLDGIDPKNDIGIFDLMRENQKREIENIGEVLYTEARRKKMAEDRAFIFTAFPQHFENATSEYPIPEKQLLRKPASPSQIAERLAQLLPDCVHIDP